MRVPIVMIIGPPRSGTTLLGNLLDLHPKISTIIEPYYIWDHHFRNSPHDQMSEQDASDPIRKQIRGSFGRYLTDIGADMVVDKSPRNSIKIPFIKAVFPEAYFVIIMRDARDTILSIQRQWQSVGAAFSKYRHKKLLKERFIISRRWLAQRPTWRLRLQSILFELGPLQNWPKKNFLNQIRWQRPFGWGPRFEGWQDVIDRVSLLEFNAYQWAHCARGIMDHTTLLPKGRVFTLKYEDLIAEPEPWLRRLFSFLGTDLPGSYYATMPPIWSQNSQKWPHAFSSEELKTIGPIVSKELITWGYEKDESWYQKI
ncbi:MAG: sulfotransferase [Deltaproteobacteria bacterium]|nr:sulfotransferase [Deltaproteobacteria bacterium]